MADQPPKSVRERRKEETRTALLDAAVEVFARRGFEGASLDEIASNAGYTRGAVYKHFANKQELLFACTDRRWSAAQTAFEGALGGMDSLNNLDIAELARLFRLYEVANPDDRIVAFEAFLFALRNPEHRERHLEHSRSRDVELAELIRTQLETFGVQPSVSHETLAKVVILALGGFTHQAMLDPDGEDLFEPFIALMIKAILSDLEHPPEPTP